MSAQPAGEQELTVSSAALAERVVRVVAALVAETRPGGAAVRVTLHCHLERDLGLDSLARAELLLRAASEFGRALPDAAITEVVTPYDLLRLIAVSAPGEAPLVAPSFQMPTGLSGPPTAATTLIEVLEWHAERDRERTHVLLYGELGEQGKWQAEAISYGDLLGQAGAVAAGLVGRGMGPRQSVALMLPTGHDYLNCFFGVMLAGGIPVPIYPPARLSQLDDHLRRHARILANAEVAVLITVAQAKGVAALLRGEVPCLREILTPEELRSDPLPLRHRPRSEDIAFLQYTSGSTGDPKGVVLSHANLLANLRAMGEAVAVSSDDVFVSWLPLYHDMGLIGAWFGALYFGMPLVLMSPLAFLARPVRWLRAISQHRATLSAAPNFAFDLCARKLADADLQGLDLSSWRLALNGAEPVSPATLAAFAARFSPYGLRANALTPVYGLAECSVGLAFPPLGRGPRIDCIQRAALVNTHCALPAANGDADVFQVPACGRVVPRHEIRIVDEGGCEVADRRVGRLQFRGPSATAGYYRNPAATKALFRDGWLDSGDYAYSVEGEIYLTGRVKDLIIRGGRNVYPYELEQAVGSLPGIRRGCVAVFASQDVVTGSERLVVLAETRVTDSRQREALRRQINDAAIDVVGMPADEIVLAPPNSVLKTSSGKIRRSASREAFEQGLIGATTPSVRLQALRLATALLQVRGVEFMQRVSKRVYGLWCWIVFLALALPVFAGVIVLRTPAAARHLVHRAARIFLFLAGMPVPRTLGSELPSGPHLLLANHCSYLDALVLCAALPPEAAYAFVAKREFVAQPAIYAFLRQLDTLFVERHEASRSVEDVAALVAGLTAGRKLVIFPEGTFSREAGLKPFHMGAFVSAARTGVPVLPCALRGTRSALRDRTWLPRRGNLAVALGEPLFPEGTDWAAAVCLRDSARSAVLALCGEHDLAR